MAYTLLDKMKTSAYAVGSAIATGTTFFGAGAAMGLSTPLIVTAAVVGTTGNLFHTAHATLKQIKKARAKQERDTEQHNDQKRLMEQLTALKPQMQKLLDKEKEDKEKKAELHQKKNGPASVSVAILPDEQAAKVAEVRKETAAKNRQKAKTWREGKLTELDAALKKLNRDLVPQTPGAIPVQSIPIVEPSQGMQTSRLEKIVQIGKGVVNGFAKAGAVTFGAIQAGATMAKTSIPLLSAGIVAPVVIVGVVGALGNAVLANKEYANELQEEEQYEKYRARKRELQAEYDAIYSLLKQLNQPEIKSRKPVSRPAKLAISLPGTIAIPQPPSPVASKEKSEDIAHEISGASQHSGEISISMAKEDRSPTQNVVLDIRPATASSGAAKVKPAHSTKNAALPALSGEAQRRVRLTSPIRMFGQSANGAMSKGKPAAISSTASRKAAVLTS